MECLVDITWTLYPGNHRSYGHLHKICSRSSQRDQSTFQQVTLIGFKVLQEEDEDNDYEEDAKDVEDNNEDDDEEKKKQLHACVGCIGMDRVNTQYRYV